MKATLEWLREEFAHGVHRHGMFKDKTRSPGGEGFKLKLHVENPTAPLSPMYFDLRLLRSFPGGVKEHAVLLFDVMLKPFVFARLADVPTAITPIVSSLSDLTTIPMVTPRVGKTHGSGAAIDGEYKPGEAVALFDDLVTEADSKIEAAKVLRDAGLVVEHVFVFLDREQGGREKLAEHGLTLHSAFTLSELLDFYREEGRLDENLFAEIRQYREAEAERRAAKD